jgi:hypothetical protein
MTHTPATIHNCFDNNEFSSESMPDKTRPGFRPVYTEAPAFGRAFYALVSQRAADAEECTFK